MLTGLPGSTINDQTVNKSIIARLFELKLIDQVKHHLYVPYPTDLIKTGHPDVELIHEDWSKYDRLSYPVYNLPNLTSDEIWRQYINNEFFINEIWAKSLNFEKHCRIDLYPDYNINCYLTGTNDLTSGGKRANQPVHLTPKARAFFSLATSEQNVAFAKSSLAFGAGDSHVHGGCAAVNRGADFVEHLVQAPCA